MSSKVSVSLLKSVVLFNVVKIISSNNNCSLHLSRNHDSPIIIIIINKTNQRKKRSRNCKSLISAIEINTYLKILPLMLTFEVNGHFLSTYCPSIASVGVLKPIHRLLKTMQNHTKTDLLVVSDSLCGLLCQEFFGVKEHIALLLESSFSLNKKIIKM